MCLRYNKITTIGQHFLDRSWVRSPKFITNFKKKKVLRPYQHQHGRVYESSLTLIKHCDLFVWQYKWLAWHCIQNIIFSLNAFLVFSLAANCGCYSNKRWLRAANCSRCTALYILGDRGIWTQCCSAVLSMWRNTLHRCQINAFPLSISQPPASSDLWLNTSLPCSLNPKRKIIFQSSRTQALKSGSTCAHGGKRSIGTGIWLSDAYLTLIGLMGCCGPSASLCAGLIKMNCLLLLTEGAV